MFDRLYVVHLPNGERRTAMEAQLAGREATWLHARPPVGKFPNFRRNPPAEFGCSLSHVKCIVRAIEDGARSPLFIEDDVVFRPGAFERLSKMELPPDWDVLYLGGHPRSDVTRVGDDLVRVGTFSFAEAYLLNGKALRPFVDFWLDRVGQRDAMFDLVLGEFAAANNGYCVWPLLTSQPKNFSQIGLRVDDKSVLVGQAWKKHLH